MIWVRIAGNPPRQFYKSEDAKPFMAEQQSRLSLLSSAGTLRSATEGETSNLTITLDNRSGQCAALFALPPLNATADVYDSDRIIFSGTVRSMDMDDDGCRISVEA